MLRVNEVFCSLQGEGARAGTVNVFVRFSGCNLACDVEPGEKSPGGFACDTEFVSGASMTTEALLAEMDHTARADGYDALHRWCILTGGEPGLQITPALLDALHAAGWSVAVETNGTIELPVGIDYIAMSPKVAEHAVRQPAVDELRYVRGHGQGIPKPHARLRGGVGGLFLSPAAHGERIDPRALVWCVGLVKQHPEWRLSVQQHKLWGLR